MSSDLLDVTITELSTNLEAVMVSLYRLQTYIINRDGSKSDASASAFTQLRKNLRAQWENLRIYLQRCQAFGVDVFTLKEALETEEPEDLEEFLAEIVDSAKDLMDRSRKLKRDYVSMEFPSTDLLRMPASGKGFNGALPAGMRPEVRDAGLQAFIDANLAAAYPDGDESLSDLKRALVAIDSSFTALCRLWESTSADCQSYLSDGITNNEVEEVAANWTRYQKAIEIAIVSVTHTSDEVLIEAVGASTSGAHESAPHIQQDNDDGAKLIQGEPSRLRITGPITLCNGIKRLVLQWLWWC